MEKPNMNPWLEIWTSPKKTLRSILDFDPKRVIIWLAIIGGILSAISWFAYIWVQYPEEQNLRHGLFFIGAAIVGAIFGIIHLYVGGWLYKLTGSWLGGVGSFIDVKCAVGWSNYPFILSQIAALISLLSIPNLWIQSIFGIINVVLAIWGIIIFFNLIGEAHRFSAWRAVLAVIIALILVFVVVMIVSLLVPLLSPLFY